MRQGKGVVAVTFPLGRYGDAHVVPDELYDATDPTARPPRDAFDVQFRVPVTLNTLLHVLASTSGEAEVDRWEQMYLELAREAELNVQRIARGVDVERSGLAPVRFATTAVIHNDIAGFDHPRWHVHVFVGATATNLLDGRTVPVHLESLRSDVSDYAYSSYAGKVRDLTTQQWGVQWGYPGDWDVKEIVAPDLVELVDSRDRGVCNDPVLSDVAAVVLPDQSLLDLAAQSEATTARARAEGRPKPGAYTPAPSDLVEAPRA